MIKRNTFFYHSMTMNMMHGYLNVYSKINTKSVLKGKKTAVRKFLGKFVIFIRFLV